MATQTVKVSWRTSPVPVVYYGGRRYTPEMAACLAEWSRLVSEENLTLRFVQGGFNGTNVTASAGTHGGDAVDVSIKNSAGEYLTKSQVSKIISLGRSVGLAVWFRTTKYAKYGTRAQGFSSYHIHAVPNGWGVPSPQAAGQATNYRKGRDGLASNQADKGPGHVSTYRTRTWEDYKKLSPGSPVKPPTTSPIPPTNSTGGLTMSDITTLLKELSDIKAQNRAIHDSIAGRANVDTRRQEDTKATWLFPIHRSAGPVAVISEIASQTDMLRSLTTMVSGLAKSSGVDEKTIVNGVVAGLTPILRGAIIEAQGDIDLEAAEGFADAVLEAFREQLNK